MTEKALTFIIIAIYLVALFGSLMLARRNLRLARGDRRGATRIAVVYFTVEMLVWLFIEHHNGLPVREFDLFFLHLATALLDSTFLWLLYVALEPFIRRRWPAWIISWSRLLVGDFRDPLVGRDILLGAAIGALFMLVLVLSHFSPKFLSQPPALDINPGSMRRGNLFFFRFAGQATAGLFVAFISVFLLLLFVVILRRERFAVLAMAAAYPSIQSRDRGNVDKSSVHRFVSGHSGLHSDTLWPACCNFDAVLLLSRDFLPHNNRTSAWYATDFTIALGSRSFSPLTAFTPPSADRNCCQENCWRNRYTFSKPQSRRRGSSEGIHW